MPAQHQVDLVPVEHRQPPLPEAEVAAAAEDEQAHWCSWTTTQSTEASRRAAASVASSQRVCAPPEWPRWTSSPLRQRKAAVPTRNAYQRPSNPGVPLPGSEYLVR